MSSNYRNNQNNNKNMENYYSRFPNYYRDNLVTYQRNDGNVTPGQRPLPSLNEQMPGQMPPANNQMPGRMPPVNNQRQTPIQPIDAPTPVRIPPVNNQIPGVIPPISEQMPGRTPPVNNQMPGHMPPVNEQMPGRMPPVNNQPVTSIEDQGPAAFSTDLTQATLNNEFFRQALWTGEYLQVTLMSIEVGGEIGYEIHPDFDQLLYIEQGEGLVVMGDSMDNLDYQNSVYTGYVVIIPAGEYHNLMNEGEVPLKLFSVYAPPAHPHGTIHETYEEALEQEDY